MKSTFAALAVLSLLLTSCRPGEISRGVPDLGAVLPTQGAGASTATSGPWADSALAAMSLEDKVGQMVMITVPGAYTSDGSREFERALTLVRDWRVGGITLLHGGVYSGVMAVNRLQRAAAYPLLVSADLEHGLAMRLTRGTNLPDLMGVGATRDPQMAYTAGRITGEEARATGITLVLSPVVDVNTNARNPVINTRSFGSDLGLVEAMAGAYIRGMRDGGVLSTAKHFPGHGSTGEDSHLELPVLSFDRPRLDSLEFAAFRSAIDSGAAAVMVGHMAVPAVDPTGLPASMSSKLVTGILRDEYHFQGLILTDAMGMAGARVVPPGRAAVMAVKAGVDILLLTDDEHTIIQALRDAVRSGEIPIERIDESVQRILAVKQALGLNRHRLVSIDSVSAHVGTPEHWEEARRIAEHAVTIVRNDGNILPLMRGRKHGVLSLVLTDVDDSRTEVNRPSSFASNEPTGSYLTQLLHRHRVPLETIRLSPASSPEEFDHALQRMQTSDVTLVSLFVRVRTSSGQIGMPPEFDSFVRRANAEQKPIVLVAFGDPYTIVDWPAARAVVCAYSDAEVMVEAVAAALFGERRVAGKLPVTIAPGPYKAGTGVVLGEHYPAHSDTLHIGDTPSSFDRVDELMEGALVDSVFPGAQLLVIKGDTIVLHKCYGHLTYDPASPAVSDSTIYDLASLTKVVATTPAIMKLYEQGAIDLDDSIAHYLPQFGTGPKQQVTIRHLLLHRGGFPPFRKLWELASTPTAALDTVLMTPLVVAPGDSTIYSDFSMITLGRIVQDIARVPLDEFVREEFYKPLHMSHTGYTPPLEAQIHAAPTEYDATWRKALVRGTVHDENAALLGGVSGNAGLFSTAMDLARYVTMLMDGGSYGTVRCLNPLTIQTFLSDHAPGQERWLGWDMKSPTGSSAGSLFSPLSFGHTGFTGTSIWVDPERRLAVILLTNRVYPTRANTRIIRFRPLLHDAVVRALS